MASSSKALPPLNISQLNAVPDWESSAQHFRRSKIECAIRHLSCARVAEKEIKDWSIYIYRMEVEVEEKDALEALTLDEDDSSVDDEEDVPARKAYEYFIFLFQKAQGENSEVFALTTNKGYKHIRYDCSMQFPRSCAKSLASLFTKVQQVATGNVFGPVSESKISLHHSLPEAVNQTGLICREYTAVGDGIKVKFRENGILIYRNFSLEQYVDIVEDLSKQKIDVPAFEWDMPGLPTGNLMKVPNDVQEQLHLNTCAYLEGKNIPAGWTFSLKVSERQYSNATAFRLCTERRRYGITSQGAIDRERFEFPGRPIAPNLEHIQSMFSESYLGFFIGQFIARKQVFIEYQTVQGEWYRQHLIDSIEGWLRTNEGHVYFKLGSLWFQIQQDYVSVVQEAFQRVISSPGCLLSEGQRGHLHLPWAKSVSETVYNRSYLELNAPLPTLPLWFDGNQKFRSRVELFDILHIADGNQVFVYHVKKSFDTHIREAVSQLVTSAQLIYNSRNTISNHPDASETLRYCHNVSPTTNADGTNRIFHALRTGALHFVLAFQVTKDLQTSASLIAKREVIRAKEEIEKLGFIFRISPISVGDT